MKKHKQRLPKWIFTTLCTALMLCTPLLALAQDDDLPCDGDDPYSNCPIDNWVILFALIVVGIAVFHLHKRAKTEQLLLHREKC